MPCHAPITTPIIRLRPSRGKKSSNTSNNFDRNPGRTVPRRPSAASVARATITGPAAALMRISARASKPLRTGPGAEETTSTPQPEHFEPQPLGEGLNERLRSSIGRRARNALKRKQRTHQHQPAAPVRCKPAREVVRKLDDRPAIHVDHIEFATKRVLDELARRTKAAAMAASKPTSISAVAQTIASTAARCPRSTPTRSPRDACASPIRTRELQARRAYARRARDRRPLPNSIAIARPMPSDAPVTIAHGPYFERHFAFERVTRSDRCRNRVGCIRHRRSTPCAKPLRHDTAHW